MLSGRQLTDMAKKGACEYRKALAYAGDKWNIKECTPKESGTSVEDVIEYVRRRMYYDSQKKKGIISDVDNESVLFDEMNNKKRKIRMLIRMMKVIQQMTKTIIVKEVILE